MLNIQKQNPGINLHFMRKHDYVTLDRLISIKMAKMSAVSATPFLIKDLNEIPTDFKFIKAEFTGAEDKLDQLGQQFTKILNKIIMWHVAILKSGKSIKRMLLKVRLSMN